jgi:hypothetical protein
MIVRTAKPVAQRKRVLCSVPCKLFLLALLPSLDDKQSERVSTIYHKPGVSSGDSITELPASMCRARMSSQGSNAIYD